MIPAFEHGPVTLYRGDCREVMAGLPDNSVDAIVTDPPYELGFMGKGWDSSGIAFDPEVWAQAFRVLKPGGHALVFGGTRTWHRVAVAIEDAGFEIRDNIAWLYGQGFPKSLDVAKAIDKHLGADRPVLGLARGAGSSRTASLGEFQAEYSVTAAAAVAARGWEGWGTALKPAFEPVVVARKPLEGTVAANVLAYGTGALNIDASRIATSDKLGGGSSTNGMQMNDGWHRPWMDDPEAVAASAERTRATIAKAEALGRHPANVMFDESQAAELDRQTGTLTSGKLAAHHARAPKDAGILGSYGSAEGERGFGDSGGGSRFFYVAKAGKDERPVIDGHQHATVKPLALMRYLVTLVTPPGGTVLEPFAGSGTTLEAAVVEGFNAIGIELDEDGTHIPLIEARLGKPHQQTLFGAL